MDKNVQSCTIPHLQYNTNFVLQIVSFNVLNWPNANYGDVKCNVQGLYYTKVACWFNLYNSHIFGADPSLCQCLKYKYKQEKIQIQRLHCKGTHCWFNLYHTTISGAQAQVCVSDPNTNTNGLNSNPHSFFVFPNRLNAGNARETHL